MAHRGRGIRAPTPSRSSTSRNEERVSQVPAHGGQNQLGLGLSPLEDRRSDCLLHDLFRLPAAVGQSCNTTAATATGSRRKMKVGFLKSKTAMAAVTD